MNAAAFIEWIGQPPCSQCGQPILRTDLRYEAQAHTAPNHASPHGAWTPIAVSVCPNGHRTHITTPTDP
jgi:hypothetical protein